MRDGQKQTFSGEGDQEPGIPPGDLIVVLDEQEHPVFTRKGHHLIMRMELELVEALCGFQKSVTTLDNRHLLITVLPGKNRLLLKFFVESKVFLIGEVIKHGELKCVTGEGMPHHKNPYEKGNLLIQFFVHFPPANFVAPEKVSRLLRVMGARASHGLFENAFHIQEHPDFSFSFSLGSWKLCYRRVMNVWYLITPSMRRW